MAVLHALFGLARRQRDFASCERWVDCLFRIHEQQQDDKGLADAYQRAALLEEDRQDAQKAAAHYEKSLEICARLGDVRGQAVACSGLGTAAALRGDMTASLDHYLRAYRLCSTRGGVEDAEEILDNIQHLHRTRGVSSEEIELAWRRELGEDLPGRVAQFIRRMTPMR